MEIKRLKNCFSISLTPHEASLLKGCLTEILQTYQSEVLTPAVEKALYQPESALDLPDHQAMEYVQELKTFRGEHSEHIQKWIQWISEGFVNTPVKWKLPAEDRDLFLMVINDHRLYRAAEFEICDADMETPLEKVTPVDKRIALLEIHLLAWLIELILREN